MTNPLPARSLLALRRVGSSRSVEQAPSIVDACRKPRRINSDAQGKGARAHRWNRAAKRLRNPGTAALSSTPGSNRISMSYALSRRLRQPPLHRGCSRPAAVSIDCCTRTDESLDGLPDLHRALAPPGHRQARLVEIGHNCVGIAVHTMIASVAATHPRPSRRPSTAVALTRRRARPSHPCLCRRRIGCGRSRSTSQEHQ